MHICGVVRDDEGDGRKTRVIPAGKQRRKTGEVCLDRSALRKRNPGVVVEIVAVALRLGVTGKGQARAFQYRVQGRVGFAIRIVVGSAEGRAGVKSEIIRL